LLYVKVCSRPKPTSDQHQLPEVPSRDAVQELYCYTPKRAMWGPCDCVQVVRLGTGQSLWAAWAGAKWSIHHRANYMHKQSQATPGRPVIALRHAALSTLRNSYCKQCP
jgi:hypothetical protein